MTPDLSYDDRPDIAEYAEVPDNPTTAATQEAERDEFRLMLEPGRDAAGTGHGWWWFVQEWITAPEQTREPRSGLLVTDPEPGGSWFTVNVGFNTHHAASFEAGEQYLYDLADERARDAGRPVKR